MGLWVPTIWLLIAGSRMISEWQAGAAIESPDQYFEGSPLDRMVLTGLLGAGLAILFGRGREAQTFLRLNVPIVLFFGFCGVSALWSEFPDVAFKRWTKSLGDIVMVAIVLTDPDPAAAVRRVLTRAAFLLIPVSVLLVKYYPEWGRGYDPWTWEPYYGGVAIGKNGLGYVCLIFGLVSMWALTQAAAPGQSRRSVRASRIAHGAVVAMALWLFWQADSATSFACFLLGSTVLLLTAGGQSAGRASVPHVMMGSIAFTALMVLVLGADATLVEAMGRDATLTGRTELWEQLGRMVVDPVLGAGYESFWLGERLEKLWSIYWWRPRQAHNGYLETFLNLGWIGVAIVAALIVRGYRNIAAAFRGSYATARLQLAFFIVALVYNVTEAAFKTMHPAWIALLLAVAIPIAARPATRPLDEAV
jgi:O-antigen ligase